MLMFSSIVSVNSYLKQHNLDLLSAAAMDRNSNSQSITVGTRVMKRPAMAKAPERSVRTPPAAPTEDPDDVVPATIISYRPDYRLVNGGA